MIKMKKKIFLKSKYEIKIDGCCVLILSWGFIGDVFVGILW